MTIDRRPRLTTPQWPNILIVPNIAAEQAWSALNAGWPINWSMAAACSQGRRPLSPRDRQGHDCSNSALLGPFGLPSHRRSRDHRV